MADDQKFSVANNPSADLVAIEAEHAQWLASEGKEGRRANLRGFDLSGMDLAGRNFMEASLRGANFSSANLSKADLRAADLAEANFTNANLTDALFSGASLSRAQFHNANATGADMMTANFTAAVAEGVNFTNAKLNGAILREANFYQGIFKTTIMREANLRGATMTESDMSEADLTSSDCRDVNFERASFSGATLKDANFRGAKLINVDLQAADFSVAIDVASDIMAHAAQAERVKLQEEQAKTAAQRVDIAAREQVLSAEKAKLQQEIAQFSTEKQVCAEQLNKLKTMARGFIFHALLWFLYAAGIAGFTIHVAMQLQHINNIRFYIIGGIALFAFSMALLSMARCIRIANFAGKMLASMHDQAVAEEVAHASISADVSVGQAPTVLARRKGFGQKK